MRTRSEAYDKTRRAAGRIPTQRKDVVDACAGNVVEHAAQFVDRRADAGDVRHRLDSEIALDRLRHVERARACTAARAVRHRYECRVQRPQFLDRFQQRLRGGLVLWRKELKGKRWALRREQVAYLHGSMLRGP